LEKQRRSFPILEKPRGKFQKIGKSVRSAVVVDELLHRTEQVGQYHGLFNKLVCTIRFSIWLKVNRHDPPPAGNGDHRHPRM